MFRVVKTLGGRPVLGRVATSRMSADQAHTQVNPRVAGLDAIFTHTLVRLSYFDLVKMGAFFCHRFLPMFTSEKKTIKSFRDEQALRKGPLLVNPLCLAAETGVAGRLENLIRRRLAAPLLPARPPLLKLNTQ